MKSTINKFCYSLIFLILLLSCEKFNYTTNENGRQQISSYSDLEKAVTGAYAKFASIFADNTWRNSFIDQGINADDLDIYCCRVCIGDSCIEFSDGPKFLTIDKDGSTDKLIYGCYRSNSSGADLKAIKKEYYTVINNSYRNMYSAIISQNYIINQVVKNINYEDGFQDLLGEVYFMRAYTYFRLTRLFGTIPLITDIDVNYNVNRASFSEIYEQIESDLKQAIQLLPVSPTKERKSNICPDRGTAKALLAEVYLTMGGYPVFDNSKYALSAQYAREVIDSSIIYGFSLIDDFAELYTSNPVTNKEMLSAIQYKSELKNIQIQNTFVANELSLATLNPIAEVQFYNNYPTNYRKEMTFATEHLIKQWDSVNFQFIEKNIYPLQSTTCYQILLKKSATIDWLKYIMNSEWYTIYILRYAHTLLTYAEASARSGNMDAMSYEAVNQVRRRANKLPINTPCQFDLTEGLTTQDFIDSVVWERAWEFTGEPEGRWFDLLRLNMIDKLNELRDPHEASPINEDILHGNFFFPIPDEDIFLNPNLKE